MSEPTQHPLRALDAIEGVALSDLRAFEDERGVFNEAYRRAWFPETDWTRTQINRSFSKAGVLRGLHYHFHQVDYWLVLMGTLRAGLVDLRASSPTFGAALTIDIRADDYQGLFIPTGVAHGFYAVTDVLLLYVVNNYYDGGRDEHGIAWNDPQFKVAWGVDAPNISPRDRDNPPFADLAAEFKPE